MEFFTSILALHDMAPYQLLSSSVGLSAIDEVEIFSSHCFRLFMLSVDENCIN